MNKSTSWSGEIKQVFQELNCLNNFLNFEPINLDKIKNTLLENKCREWSNSLQSSPKLRTYVGFKTDYILEPYLCKIKDRNVRAILAKFRCGVLPLHIESGRWNNTPLENRICCLCKEGIEDEVHFAFVCSKLSNKRESFINEMRTLNNNFGNLIKTLFQNLQTVFIHCISIG